MSNNWKDITYLKFGNAKQQEIFQVLDNLKVLEILKSFDATLVSTYNIEIEVENSDLDIICQISKEDPFKELLYDAFGHLSQFEIHLRSKNPLEIVCRFFSEGYLFEVFGSETPVVQQNAFRHLNIMKRFLSLGNESLKKAVIDLKAKGYKSEAAFAKILDLSGDPFLALLEVENMKDKKIKKLIPSQYLLQKP